MPYSSSYTERYPDLFTGLSDEDAFAITQVLANGHHEGWNPTREDIADLIDVSFDRITEAEYDRRTRYRADLVAGRVKAASTG